MAESPKKVEEQKQAQQTEISLKDLNDKLQARYQELVRALNSECNIATRYEIKVRIEELSRIAESILR